MLVTKFAAVSWGDDGKVRSVYPYWERCLIYWELQLFKCDLSDA